MRYICKIGTEIGAEKGDLTEWSIVVVWKTIEVQASVGSNPTVSAKMKKVGKELWFFADFFAIVRAK